MVLKSLERSGLAVLLLLLLANPADLSSCGPFFPSAVFTRPTCPDDEQEFFHGHLGILQRSYERRYLAMAFRILSGEPLSDAQIDSVSDLDRYRTSDVDDAVTEWLDARRQVPGAPQVEIEPYRQTNLFSSYITCNADAFEIARRTLGDLIRQTGQDSAEVHDWLAAQDNVFLNCFLRQAIPDPVPPASSERVRSNRAYQIAAAYFYSGAYDQSRAAFLQIAADPQSQWHSLAPYLVARTYLRQGNYAAAEQQLNTILDDPKQSAIHRQSRLLLDYARAKLDPGAQLLALSKRMMQRNEADLGHDLSDYTFIFDHFENGPYYSGPFDQAKFNSAWKQAHDALNAVAANDELTNWIVQFQGTAVTKRADYVQLWRSTKSLAWLLLAIPAANEKTIDVIDAARAVPPDSPAYATARYETAGWLIAAGHRDEAAALLDDVLKHAEAHNRLDTSSVNAFRAERMQVAKNFNEFLTFAPRTIVDESSEGGPDFLPSTQEKPEPLGMFDDDATTAFNQFLPLPLWLNAVQHRTLKNRLRTELAQSGWVRATVLDQDGSEFARSLAELKPSYAAGLQPYLNSQDPATRQFEAVFFILHHPEMSPSLTSGVQRGTPDGRIDDFRDNWWGPTLPREYPPPQPPPDPRFLTPAERAEAEREQDQLATHGSAPSFLSSIVVTWAKSHPADPRNAEALALAVKTSRFSPQRFDASKSAAVERAFRLLHTRYPSSIWARRTPYWY